jgi:hypothetical protein
VDEPVFPEGDELVDGAGVAEGELDLASDDEDDEDDEDDDDEDVDFSDFSDAELPVLPLRA